MQSKWTEEDLTILETMYPINSHEDILEKLIGRTWRAIKTKAVKLKIRRPKNLQLSIERRRETTKKCYKCGEIKPLDDFQKCEKTPRGIQNICRVCKNERGRTEENKAKNREHYQENIEHIREIDRLRYYRDKEKRTELNNKCRKARGRCEEVNKRRAKIKNLAYEFTKGDWSKCLDHFNELCCYCGGTGILQQEHFIPLTKGGNYTKDNILPACNKCNNSKNNRNFEAWYPKQLFYDIGREIKILSYLTPESTPKGEQL